MNWSIPWTVGGHLFPAVFAMLGVKLARMMHGSLDSGDFVISSYYGVGGAIVGLVVCSTVINKRIWLPGAEVLRLLSALGLATLSGLIALVGCWLGAAAFGPYGAYLGLGFQFAAGLLFVVALGIRADRRSRRRKVEKGASPLTTDALVLR